MALRSFRASKAYAIIMVHVAVFTDMMLASLVAPVLPFALWEMQGLNESQVQIWNSVLLSTYGACMTVGCGSHILCLLYCFDCFRPSQVGSS